MTVYFSIQDGQLAVPGVLMVAGVLTGVLIPFLHVETPVKTPVKISNIVKTPGTANCPS